MKDILVFPGQGSQSPGMGMGFTSSERIWKEADSIVGFSISDIVSSGDAPALNETRVTQPAVYVTEVLILEELLAAGLKPSACAGHSLGEYAAVVASGSLSWQEGLELVSFRGEVFERTASENPGGMAAVIGLEQKSAENILSDYSGRAVIANYNSPGQYVVSSAKDILPEVTARLKEAGAKMVVPLKVSGGFHSYLLEDASLPMREKIDTLKFKDPKIPFYTNNTGLPLKTAEDIKEALIKQVTSPVRWIDLIERICGDFGSEARFIEAGPGKVLQGLIKRIDRKIITLGVSSPGDIPEDLGEVYDR